MHVIEMLDGSTDIFFYLVDASKSQIAGTQDYRISGVPAAGVKALTSDGTGALGPQVVEVQTMFIGTAWGLIVVVDGPLSEGTTFNWPQWDPAVRGPNGEWLAGGSWVVGAPV